MEENLTTYDSIFLYNKKSLTNSSIENKNTSSSNNINNNFYFNKYQYAQKLNLNQSFISIKDNPNDFETFNFNYRNSLIRISINNDNHINNQNIVEKETKSNSTNQQEPDKIKNGNNRNKPDFNNKLFGFSFLNTKTNDFRSNKSFVNFPIEENNFMNKINKDPEVNINDAINIEYMQNLMLNRERFNTEAHNPNNFANTFDSNYGKCLILSLFIAKF